MNCKTVNQILSDTAYVRTSCTKEELQCAEYLRAACAQMGLDAVLEPFPLTMYTEEAATLTVDGKEIECKGYFGSANGTLEAPLYYLSGTDKVSLKKCKGRIVLVDKPMGYKLYDMLAENGAVGFITYSGNLCFSDRDIDRKEIRFETDTRLFGVNIHVSDAVELVKKGAKSAKIMIAQTAYPSQSHNVILDLEGETEETVLICAHYDSTSLSKGAYDNMSGCIGLLYLAEYFASRPHRRRIRLLWCGSEERGLLGSLAYCRMYESELKNTVLNINLDMLGSIMGEFTVFSCVNEAMTEFLEKFTSKRRFSASVRHAIRSSDSNSFVYYGVPAVSFARYAPSNTALIHTRYDTVEVMSARRLLDDMKLVCDFTEYVANEPVFPMSMEISEKIKNETEEYMQRKLSAAR